MLKILYSNGKERFDARSKGLLQSFVTVITKGGVRVTHAVLLSEEVRASCSSQRNDFMELNWLVTGNSVCFWSICAWIMWRDKSSWQNFAFRKTWSYLKIFQIALLRTFKKSYLSRMDY